MGRIRIGELLGQMGKLSQHDIHEILQEQVSSRHRFGDIALTWGLCQPEHIWKAWVNQHLVAGELVDLAVIGIDSQATAAMPAELARRHHMIPLRMFDGELIVASRIPVDAQAAATLSQLLNLNVRVVFAEADQISAAIESYYPAQADPRLLEPISA